MGIIFQYPEGAESFLVKGGGCHCEEIIFQDPDGAESFLVKGGGCHCEEPPLKSLPGVSAAVKVEKSELLWPTS